MKPTQPATQRADFPALLFLVLVFLALGVGFGLWAGSVPLFAAALGLDALHIGLVLLCVAGGAVLAMARSGQLATRFGAGRVALVAAGLFALSFLPLRATFALVRHNGDLTVAFDAAALVMGAAMGITDVAMNAMATAVEHARGRAVMSRLHAAFSLGGLCGALLASLLIARGGNAGGLWLTAAVVVGVLALAAWMILARAGLASMSEPESVAADGASGPRALPGLVLLGIGLLTALAMICEGAIGDWGGVFTLDALHAPQRDTSFGYAAFSVAMVAVRLSGDALTERLGVRRLMVSGALLGAIGLLAVAISPALHPGLPLALGGFACTGLGMATLVPLAFSSAGHIGRAAAGEAGASRALARTATWGYGGFLLGPPLVSVIVAGIGLRGAFVVLALAALAMGAIALVNRGLPREK